MLPRDPDADMHPHGMRAARTIAGTTLSSPPHPSGTNQRLRENFQSEEKSDAENEGEKGPNYDREIKASVADRGLLLRRRGLLALIRQWQPAARTSYHLQSTAWMPASHSNVRCHAMASRDDDLRVQPGRIRHGNKGARKSKSYVAQVMRAAKKAGHTGSRFAGGSRGGRSTFGRGGKAARSLGLKSPSRRVVVKARVVRHRGSKFRSAPLAKHILYLKREGVTRDGQDARMFNARSDDADAKTFAERCEEDRHHFRFIVSPEDAPNMANLKTFTRKLMKQAERDLGTKLDWVAVDHWNTDNPHIHVWCAASSPMARILSSAAITSAAASVCAQPNVSAELGPRSEQEIRSALEKDVRPNVLNFDRSLRNGADDNGGIVDCGRCTRRRPELRRLLAGGPKWTAGLAEQIAPGQWTLKPGRADAA